MITFNINIILCSRCRCRHRSSHLGAFLRLVKAPHDHLALGRLANVFRRALEGVGEEGESCGSFDRVDCAGGWYDERAGGRDELRLGTYLA